MKNKFLCSVLSLILIMAFPISVFAVENTPIYKDITDNLNSDLIVRMRNGFAWTEDITDILYDGDEVPSDKFTINTLEYKLFGNFDADGNDAIKISGGNYIEIPFNNELIKTVGIVATSVSGGAALKIKAEYEDSPSIEETFEIAGLTEQTTDFYSAGTVVNAIVYEGWGMAEFAKGTANAYFNAYTIENEVKKLSNVIFENTGSVDIYILALSTLAFDEDELADEAESAISQYLEKYADKNFTQIDGEEYKIEEVEALRDGLIAGSQTQPPNEHSTTENIEKFNNMSEGYYLYHSWIAEKNIVDTYNYYEKTQADFSLFTPADKENMEKAIEAYEKLDAIDYGRLIELYGYFSITPDIEVDFDNYIMTKALYDDYLAYLEIKELEVENTSIYNTYKNATIASLTDGDLTQIAKYITNCERLVELEETPDEAKLNEMKQLIEFKQNNLNSEKPVYADLSTLFNFESIGTKGDKTPEDWMGGSTYNRFRGKDYKLIKNLDISTGIITLDDQFCTATPKADGSGYSLKWNTTGDAYSFKLTGLPGGEKDTVEINKLSESARTIALTPRVADKIYLAMTSNIYNGALTTQQQIIVNYTDGTQSEPFIINPNCGYNQVWGGNSADGVVYPYQNGYFYVQGANALADKEGTLDYVSTPQEKENGVVGTYALSVDKTKQVASVTFGTPSANPMFLYAITQNPVLNTEFLSNAQAQWDIVKNYDFTNLSQDELEDASLMMSYKKEADERGIVVSDYADREKMAALGDVILTVSGNVGRYDIDTLKAELSFSTAVDEAVLKDALNVYKNNTLLNDSEYNLTLSSNSKNAEIEINCDENGGDSLKIEISTALAPASYPNNKLIEKYELSYSVPEFLTVAYADNKVTVTNNSSVPVDYKVYFTYINGETGEVAYAKEFSSSDMTDHETSYTVDEAYEALIYITDSSYNHIGYYSQIPQNSVKPGENSDYKTIKHQISDNTINISGFTSSKLSGKKVNLKVTDKDENFIAFLSTLTDNSGGFTFNLKVKDAMITSEGYAKITLSGDDFNAPYTDSTSVYLAKFTSKKTAIENIKSAVLDTDAVRETKLAENTLGLSSALFTAMIDNIGDRLIACSNEFDATDFDGAKEIILRELVLEAFSEGKTELLLKDGKLLYEDIIEYKKIDENNVTLYSVFTDLLTQTGKEKAVSDLSGKTLATTADLRNELAIATANSVLNNCSQGGYEKYICLLTNANATLLGIDISNYTGRSDKTALLSYLTTKTITDVDDFETYVKAYVTPSDPSDLGGGGSFGGGSSGSSTGGFAMTPDVLTNQNVIPSSEIFNDLSKAHWAYSYIADMKAKNIINGDEKGNFNPDKNITRAEFIKILVASMNGTELGTKDTQKVFNDIKADDWYYKYVIAAYENGIIKGDENGNFNPNAYITREDMCVMLYRTMVQENNSSQASFTDSALISEYAVDAVGYLAEQKLVGGFEDGSFRPKDNATRAQCAKIISVYLNK